MQRNTLPVIRKRVGVPSFVPLEPVAATVKILGSTFGCHLNLRAGVAAELCSLTGSGDFELSNSIDIESVCELLIHAGVRYRLTVHSEIVLIGAPSVNISVHAKAGGGRVCRDTRHELQQGREIAAVERDVNHLSASDDTRALCRYGFQRHCRRFD